jgi:hypothetical protein
MAKRKLVAVAGMCLALAVSSAAPSANAAFGFCSQPMAPTAYLSKPRKPFCATDRSCEQWEVDMYRNRVRDYYSNLRQYANEVDQFYRDAADYVDCMSDLD